MAYDQALARRIRELLAGAAGLEEKKMFGGIGFLVQGNMACGVHGDDLIVRVGPEKSVEALAQPYARPFDMTGRPMSGWVMVAPDGLASERELRSWIDLGLKYARTLPAK